MEVTEVLAVRSGVEKHHVPQTIIVPEWYKWDLTLPEHTDQFEGAGEENIYLLWGLQSSYGECVPAWMPEPTIPGTHLREAVLAGFPKPKPKKKPASMIPPERDEL